MSDRPRLFILHLPDSVIARVTHYLRTAESPNEQTDPAVTAFLAEVDKRVAMYAEAAAADPGPKPFDHQDDPREIITRAAEDLLTVLRVYAGEAGVDPDNLLPALDRLLEELA